MITLWQASQQCRAGEIDASDLTQQALDAIHSEPGEGARAFTQVYAAQALQQAQQPTADADGLPWPIVESAGERWFPVLPDP